MVQSEIAGFSTESYETLQCKATKIHLLSPNIRRFDVVQAEPITRWQREHGGLRTDRVKRA
jgi:hypothetical protein